jgi:hypothetical protein
MACPTKEKLHRGKHYASRIPVQIDAAAKITLTHGFDLVMPRLSFVRIFY